MDSPSRDAIPSFPPHASAASGGEGRREWNERRGGGGSDLKVPPIPDPSPPRAARAGGRGNRFPFSRRASSSFPFPLAGEGARAASAARAGEGSASGASEIVATPHPARCSQWLATRHPLPQGERGRKAISFSRRVFGFAPEFCSKPVPKPSPQSRPSSDHSGSGGPEPSRSARRIFRSLPPVGEGGGSIGRSTTLRLYPIHPHP
jgi:hypothetical protein